MCSGNSAFRYLSKRIQSKDSNISTQCSRNMIHNSQSANNIYAHQQMSKQNVIYIYIYTTYIYISHFYIYIYIYHISIYIYIYLEWVAMSFSRGSSWPRDQTRVEPRQILYHSHHLGKLPVHLSPDVKSHLDRPPQHVCWHGMRTKIPLSSPDLMNPVIEPPWRARSH